LLVVIFLVVVTSGGGGGVRLSGSGDHDDDGDDIIMVVVVVPFEIFLSQNTPLPIFFLSLLRRYIQDHGSVFDTGSATHRLTMYRASSGSLVFGAGTVQWVWALDPEHDPNDPPRANT
jgi:hypothetical protein